MNSEEILQDINERLEEQAYLPYQGVRKVDCIWISGLIEYLNGVLSQYGDMEVWAGDRSGMCDIEKVPKKNPSELNFHGPSNPKNRLVIGYDE